MKFSKTWLAWTLLIHVYFWVVGRCIYGWLRCFDVTHCTCTYAHTHFVSRSHVVWMLHVYPGKTLMFSFCQAKSVVSTASDVITLLHNAYLLNWLAITYNLFHMFIFVSAGMMLRCYTLPTGTLALNLYKSLHTVIFVSDVTMLRCYNVMLLRCYAVTMFV